jgi:TonB-dependent SusC/RagA subfamily outer membrane receptor
MICFTSLLYGQRSPVMDSLTLIVTDSLKKPVGGASIYVDGKLTNSESGIKGNYKISIKDGAKKILVVSDSSGRGETKIKGKKVISLTLYSEYYKKNQATTTATIDNTTLKRRFSTYSNIYDMIRAEVPGVMVSGNNIVLQGMKTYGGSNTALLVVDGIPTDNLNNIIPSDVKSIRLMKGPEAAIYGMMGANGVILIETLRGTNKK